MGEPETLTREGMREKEEPSAKDEEDQPAQPSTNEAGPSAALETGH
jgi:hypothetical protein